MPYQVRPFSSNNPVVLNRRMTVMNALGFDTRHPVLQEKFREYRREIFDIVEGISANDILIRQVPSGNYPVWRVDIRDDILFEVYVGGIGWIRIDRAIQYVEQDCILRCPVSTRWWKRARMIPVPSDAGTSLDGRLVSPDSFNCPSFEMNSSIPHEGFWRCAECSALHFIPDTIFIEPGSYEVYCRECQGDDAILDFDPRYAHPIIRNPRGVEDTYRDDDEEDRYQRRGQYHYSFDPMKLFPGFILTHKKKGDKEIYPRERTIPRLSSYPLRTKTDRGDKTRWFGVEYECVFDATEAPFEEINSVLDGFAVSTFDSSIGDGDEGGNGVEIITVPASLRYHRKRWKPFFEKFEGQFCKDESAGCHIHVSSASMSRFTTKKLFYFLNRPVNQEFIFWISDRERLQFDRWCSFHSCSLSKDYYPTEYKYSVINQQTDRPTYELRLFDWARTYDHLMMCLEFFDALIDFCSESSMKDLTYPVFIQWVKTYRKKSHYHLKKFFASNEIPSQVEQARKVAEITEREEKERRKKQKEAEKTVLHRHISPLYFPSPYPVDYS